MNTNGSPAVVFMVSAGLTYEVIAAACSSPQTAEINADRRADTLMKWVWIGLAQVALFAALAATIEHQNDRPIWPALTGVGLAAALMLGQYKHALHAGLTNPGPTTETTSWNGY